MALSPLALSAIVGGGTGIAGGITSYMSTKLSNEAAERANDSMAKAIKIQMAQFQMQAALEREKLFNQAHQLESRMRVLAGESGLGLAGPYAAANRQIGFDAERNRTIINQNLSSSIDYVRSQWNPVPYTSPIAAAIQGFMGGMGAGLQLAQNVQAISATRTTPQTMQQNTPQPQQNVDTAYSQNRYIG